MCRTRGEEKAHKKKPLLPEKVVIFHPRVGGVGCSEGAVAEEPARHLPLPHAGEESRPCGGPSAKQGGSDPFPSRVTPAACVPVSVYVLMCLCGAVPVCEHTFLQVCV